MRDLRLFSTLLLLGALVACSADVVSGADVVEDVLADAGGEPPAPLVLRAADFAAPAAAARPWVRWWWPGNDVDDAELVRELGVLAAAGFGGAEIQAFDAALDREAAAETLARRLSVDSESYYAHVAVALAAAEELGLQIDLNQGSGWPAGGMNVPVEESLQTLVWGEKAVEGPTELVLETLTPKQAPFYLAAEAVVAMGEKLTRYLPAHAELVGVIAARVTGGKRAIGGLDLSDTLELDAGSVLDLTSLVDEDGGLRWQVPSGKWQIVSFFRMPDGQYLSLPALPDPEQGFVADHFSTPRVLANLEHWMGERTGLAPFYGGPLRGLFNDSFEWKVELLFADDMLEEFARRRGYDLLPWLPVLFVPGADNFVFEAGRVARAPEFAFGPDDERVRRDYRETLSELFVERFLAPTGDWAEQRGLLSRVQAYGLDVDVIRAAGAAHIPEVEQLYAGGAEMFLRVASSAAHLYGRELVSAETFVWMSRDFMTTPLKMRIAADKLFGAGVNQLVYHGFPYRQEGDFGVIGWTAFSSRYGGANTFSSSFAEPFEYFEVLPDFNRYVARCQHLLRQGEAKVDLLVHYPFIGFPTSLPLEEDAYEPLLGGYMDGVEPEMRGTPFDALLALLGEPVSDPRSLWLLSVWPLLQKLESEGYTWDWVNDHSLAVATAEQGGIRVREARYRGLLLVDSEAMSPEAAAAAAALGAAGVPVGLVGTTPERAHGFHDKDAQDAEVGAAMAALAEAPAAFAAPLSDESAVVAGLQAAGLAALMRPEGAPALRFQYRDMGEGFLAFVRNPSRELAEATLRFSGHCPTLDRLDPWTGELCRMDDSEVGLPPYGSLFLACGVALDETPPPCPAPEGPFEQELHDTWTLAIGDPEREGPPVPVDTYAFQDWRDVEALRHAGGPAVFGQSYDYRAALGRVWLQVGSMNGAAEVFVNGASAGRILLPPYTLEITAHLVEGDNAIDLVYTPPLRNYLVGRAIEGDARYAQFTGKEDTLIEAGITGGIWFLTSTPAPRAGVDVR